MEGSMSDGVDGARIEALGDRLKGHDRRLNAHDGKIQILSEQVAVIALKQGQMADDLKELVGELQEVTHSMDKRLGRLIAGVWAVAIVFLPIAYDIIKSGGA
jgi:ABC-type transporter Mla subunit MlaD